MTLDDLERTLPSGLHDALVRGFRVDCAALELGLDVEVGDWTPEAHFRPAGVALAGLLSFEFDPCHRGTPLSPWGEMSMDTGSIEAIERRRPKGLPDTLPAGAFSNYIFLSEWEAFIYVAARTAELTWKSAVWRRHETPEDRTVRPEAAGASTLDELAGTLPVGFQGAQLHRFEVDCEAMTLALDLGLREAPETPAGRLARVTLGGLLTFQCEPRRAGQLLTHRGPVGITCGPIGAWPEPVDSIPTPLPAGSFASFVLLHEWDTCLYVAARTTTLAWA